MPTTDVLAKGGDLVIHLDLPGIDPAKDLKITFGDGELSQARRSRPKGAAGPYRGRRARRTVVL